MTNEIKYMYFRLDNPVSLIHHPSEKIRELDWHSDLEMIRRFYKHFTPDTIDPPEADEGCGKPLAIVINGEIASFAIPFSFNEGEIEIGAVVTLAQYRNKG